MREPERPHLRVFSLMPGNVLSKLTHRDFAPFATDDGMLTGGMTLYLSTERADYLRGGLCSVNCEFAPSFLLSCFLPPLPFFFASFVQRNRYPIIALTCEVSVPFRLRFFFLLFSKLVAKTNFDLGDVDEMERHQEEIVEKGLLRTAFLNARLGAEGQPWEV